jgi:hypothetical protein
LQKYYQKFGRYELFTQPIKLKTPFVKRLSVRLRAGRNYGFRQFFGYGFRIIFLGLRPALVRTVAITIQSIMPKICIAMTDNKQQLFFLFLSKGMQNLNTIHAHYQTHKRV